MIALIVKWLRSLRNRGYRCPNCGGINFLKWAEGYRAAYRNDPDVYLTDDPDVYAGATAGLLDRLVR